MKNRNSTKYYPLILLMFICLSNSGLVHGQVVLNELMADNLETIADPDFGNNSDWAEIYNGNGSSISLNGYTLSDDINEPAKWTFPDGTSIPSKGFLLVWLDNENTGLHTNFRLSKSGESLYLFDGSLQLVDSINFTEQIEDVSYGRNPDGGSEWVYFNSASPGASNISSGDLVAAKPIFSMESGFYSGRQTLTLTPQSSQSRIYYTLDGSDPGTSSRRYNQPIRIDTTISVRAIQTEEGFINSPIVTKTFLIDEPTTLPVFSIVTDPDNLWDIDEGIYVEGRNYSWGWFVGNFWQDWEKPCYVEFWESDRDLKVSQGAALKITGALTRTASQKSLRLIAKSEYGKTKFSYRFFKDKEISSFNDIVLRASGNDWGGTMMADGLMQTIVAGQMDIDYQAYRPAILFLNGQYWGIHNIREKIGDDYIEENHGFSKDNIDLISKLDDVRDGDMTNYNSLMDYIQSHNLNTDEEYQYVSDRIDLQEYVNYYVTQIFYANHDWPAGNIKYWRPRINPSQWRWILHDTDLAFLYPYQNTIEWVTNPNPEYGTENDFFIGLMKSRKFQKLFLDTYQFLMATTFQTDRLIHIIDSLQANIEPEISRHIDRWRGYHGWTFITQGGDSIANPSLNSYAEWQANVNSFRTFARNRPDEINQFVADHFGIGQPIEVTLSLDNPGTGKIWVNQNKATDNVLSMIYFTNQELQLIPLNNANTVFDHWALEEGFYQIGDWVPIISKNSEWKYLDSGVYPGSDWTSDTYNDSDWSSGNGILGYNIDNAGTIIDYGDDAADKHISYWFRKEFEVDQVSDWQSLQFQLLRDDGALIYLNGFLVVASNMAEDADYRSTALTGVDNTDESRYFNIQVPVTALRNGRNILAVEVHQVSATSSDLGFDLSVVGRANRSMGSQTLIAGDTIQTLITEKAHYIGAFNQLDQPVNLYLNEVMSDNLSTVITPYGRTPDWFEIYNPNDYPIDVGGLYVTDNLLNPDKFRIPSDQPEFTFIPANDFIYLIADGDRLYNSGYVNLQISSVGEELGIYQKIDQEYYLIDSLYFPGLNTDASFGRYPDGEDEWFLFSKSATPGEPNQVNNQEIPDLPVYLMQNYPNPFGDQTNVVFGNKEEVNLVLEVRDLQGRLVKTLTNQTWPAGQHEIIWTGDNNSGLKVNSGLYLIVIRSGFYSRAVKTIYILQ